MSRTFGQDTSGDRLTTASSPISGYAFSAFAWYKPVVQAYATNGRTVTSIANSASGAEFFGIGLANSGALQLVARNTTYYTNSTTNLATAGEWNALGGAYTSDSSRVGYIWRPGDTSIDATTGAISSVAYPAGIDRLGIGAFVDSSPNQECYGDVQHVAWWNVALTQAEFEMLMIGKLSPLRVRPQNLVFYAPYLGRNSPEIDIIGARALTVTGTTASAAEPAINLAKTARGIISGSSSAVPPPPPTPPAAPSGLAATSLSSSQIRLDWTDNSADEDGFRVERSLNGVSFTQIASPAADVTTYTDVGLSASTTYYYRVRAYNAGGNSAYTATVSAETAPSVPSPEVPLFPRVASMWIGAPHNYDLTAYQQGAAQFDMVVWNNWELWGQGRAMSFAQACANAKAINPNLQIFQYMDTYAPIVIPFRASNPLLDSTIQAYNWWLRTSYPSGSIVEFAAYQGLVCNQYADLPLELAGQSFIQWFMSTYARDMYFNGTYAGLSGRPQANPSLDGIFFDNIILVPLHSGDFKCDGVSENKDTASVNLVYRQGMVSGANAYKAMFPSKKLMGNAAFALLVTYNPWGLPIPEPVYNQQWHGAFLEGYIGFSWSTETWGTPATMLQAAKVHGDMLIEPTDQIMGVNRLYTTTSTNFQDFRHGFCSALCASDGYVTYCDAGQDTYGSTTGFNRTAQWFDEYDNAGTQRYYLGAAEDGRISATWTQGVYRRRFANGWVLWNPKGNGTRTISLGQTMRKIQGRSGYSDLTVNNGATVTSVTLQPRDGLVLLKV